MLGGDDEQADLENALRAVRVPKAEVTQDELVDALAYQLELVGLQLGPVARGRPGDHGRRRVPGRGQRAVRAHRRAARTSATRSRSSWPTPTTRSSSFDAAEAAAAAEPTIDLTDGADGDRADGSNPTSTS